MRVYFACRKYILDSEILTRKNYVTYEASDRSRTYMVFVLSLRYPIALRKLNRETRGVISYFSLKIIDCLVELTELIDLYN